MGNKKRKVVEESDSSDDEAALERAALEELAPSHNAAEINNKNGLLDRLEEISRKNPSFLETLALTTAKPLSAVVENVQDDLQRELKFYEASIEAAKQGEEQLKKLGVAKIWRPTDYYCEMVKTDKHMLKIKTKLIEEEKNIAAAEERRKQREQKKFGKKIQAEVRKEKQQEKKRQMADVQKFRDEAKSRGGDSAENSNGKKRKREGKDKKYGIGSREKKMAKRNTAQSSRSLDGFSGRKHGQPVGRAKKPKARGAGAGRTGRRNKR